MEKTPKPAPDSSQTSKLRSCKRYNDAGHAHALTFTCFHRQKFLSKDRARLWLVEAIHRAQQKHAFDLWAYCIMPEHAHILLWPTREPYDISDILSSIKQSVAKRAVLFVQAHSPEFLKHMQDRQPGGRTCYRFWQRGGGYDRNLFEPATIFKEIDYFHTNPVKAGLCAVPEDWYWSSAADYAGVRKGPVELQRESLPVFGELG
jgi:putative transposase